MPARYLRDAEPVPPFWRLPCSLHGETSGKFEGVYWSRISILTWGTLLVHEELTRFSTIPLGM
jgi:hypothetical protein